MNETWVVSLEQRNIMMTWRDSWQYVTTWRTWHDVKAWLHKHEVGYLTSSINRCQLTGAMIYLCFARYLDQEVQSNYRRLRDLHARLWNWRSRHELVFVLPRWFLCCFLRLFVGEGIRSNYCHFRDSCLWISNSMSCQGLSDHDVTFSFQGRMYRSCNWL